MPVMPRKKSDVAVGRKDPPTRELEGYHSTRLINQDPSKTYVFAYEGDQDTGVNMYEHLGYEVIRYEEGGVRMAIKKATIGEPIRYRGHVLMAADKAEILARWQAAQDAETVREKRIVNGAGGIDPLRGISNNVLARGELKFENETRELVPVTE